MVIGPVLSGPNGPGTGFSFSVRNNYIGMGSQVAKDSKKKQKIYEILNALYTDLETYLMTAFGVEGTSYKMQYGIPTPLLVYADSLQRGAKIGAGNYYGLFGPNPLHLLVKIHMILISIEIKMAELDKFHVQPPKCADTLFNSFLYIIPRLSYPQ